MPPSKDSKRRMLVEGMDDQYTIINLLKQHGVDWDDSSTSPPYIHKCGGIDNLLNQISVTVKGAEYTDIAIVVDANGSIQDRWKSLRGRFADADIELPEQLDTTGTVVVDRAKSRNIGLWIMPDNTMNGALEDFVVNMMPESDRLLDYAQCASKKAKKYGAKFDDIDYQRQHSTLGSRGRTRPACHTERR